MTNTHMIAGKQTGSLINHIMSGATKADVPAVGMGATILCWTDRKAGTIVSVTTAKSGAVTFVVQMDHAKRSDNLGMSDSQSYEYSPNVKGPCYTFKQVTRGHAKGAWREDGRKNGNGVLIGHRDQYFDYSF